MKTSPLIAGARGPTERVKIARITYEKVDPCHPKLADLIARHAAHGDEHYPAESNHHQDGAGLAADGTVLFVGWLEGEAVAMGGYKLIEHGHGEVKSMHVARNARGQGAGAAILDLILDDARARGVSRMSLETGSQEGSVAARKLYERAGFSYCQPFGGYGPDPMSVFMTKVF